MGKKASASKRRHVKRGGRGRRSTNVGYPPALPFDRMGMNCVVRIASSSKANINSATSETLSWSKVLTGPWAALKSVFGQFRITKLRMWLIPGVSPTQTGIACFVLCPAKELSIPSTGLKFGNLASVPGSVTRKPHQPLCLEWHPTSPDERTWRSLDSTADFVDFIYMTTGMTSSSAADGNSYTYESVVDYHIQCRGIAGNILKWDTSAESMVDLDSMAI